MGVSPGTHKPSTGHVEINQSERLTHRNGELK